MTVVLMERFQVPDNCDSPRYPLPWMYLIFSTQVNYWSKKESITVTGFKKILMASWINYHRLKLLLDLNLIKQNISAFAKTSISVFLLLSCVLQSLQIFLSHPLTKTSFQSPTWQYWKKYSNEHKFKNLIFPFLWRDFSHSEI